MKGLRPSWARGMEDGEVKGFGGGLEIEPEEIVAKVAGVVKVKFRGWRESQETI